MTNEFIEVPVDAHSLCNRRPIQGVGINDASYKVTNVTNGIVTTCPFYRTWTNVIERCYGPTKDLNHPWHKDATMCKEWHVFSVFRSWMEQQPWKGNNIDKDLLFIGNKHYSPKYCVFIPAHINQTCKRDRVNKSGLPTGVGTYQHKNSPLMYKTGFLPYGKKRQHKYGFTTPEEAYEWYRQKKYDYLIRLAATQTDPKIESAIITWADKFFSLPS